MEGLRLGLGLVNVRARVELCLPGHPGGRLLQVLDNAQKVMNMSTLWLLQLEQALDESVVSGSVLWCQEVSLSLGT